MLPGKYKCVKYFVPVHCCLETDMGNCILLRGQTGLFQSDYRLDYLTRLVSFKTGPKAIILIFSLTEHIS